MLLEVKFEVSVCIEQDLLYTTQSHALAAWPGAALQFNRITPANPAKIYKSSR
jgi:hypothetical protein